MFNRIPVHRRATQSAFERTLIVERELQDAGSEHGSRGMTWVDAVVEGLIEEFCELVSAGDHSSNHSLQEAVAPCSVVACDGVNNQNRIRPRGF